MGRFCNKISRQELFKIASCIEPNVWDGHICFQKCFLNLLTLSSSSTLRTSSLHTSDDKRVTSVDSHSHTFGSSLTCLSSLLHTYMNIGRILFINSMTSLSFIFDLFKQQNQCWVQLENFHLLCKGKNHLMTSCFTEFNQISIFCR